MCVATEAAGPTSVAFVRTTGNDSELVKTIPITRRVGASPRVVMSMGKRLPDLSDGDRLEVTTEVEVTNDCVQRGRRCAGPPYRYDPKVRARLVLARSATGRGGAGAISLAKPVRHVCLQRLPSREHHCVLVFGHDGIDIPEAGDLPCDPRRCHVNLVLDAHNRKAERGDMLILGVDREDGSIAQDRGRINVTLLRPGSQPKPPPHSTDERLRTRLVPDHRPRVIYSLRLPQLHHGDQLTVSARASVDIAHLPYNTFTGAHLIAADARRRTRSGAFIRSVAQGGLSISENTGFNCTHPRTPCTIRKVGVMRLSRDAVDQEGHPRPVFLNLVVATSPKRRDRRSDDRVKVLKGGMLSARLYRR
jgi:hypothetical protein